MVDILLYYAASVLAIIFVLVPHEFAHAAVAYANGDPTPKLNGRITLNPIKHFDPIGFVMCALVGFGWAKPVPINSANFKHYKLGLFTTAIAGVVANYLMAFIVYPLYLLCATRLSGNLGTYFLTTLLRLIYSYNLSIAVFNLLPLYPLDGFKVLEALTKPWNKVRQFLGKYGQIILLVLVAESFICDIAGRLLPIFYSFDVLGYVLQFAVRYIGWPISAFWGLFL